MWAVGRYDIGLSEKGFWRLTLRQFDALVKRFSINVEKADQRSAMICASIYEQNRDHKKRSKPFTPEDFLGTKKKANKWQDQLEMVKQLNKMMGGKDKRKIEK